MKYLFTSLCIGLVSFLWFVTPALAQEKSYSASYDFNFYFDEGTDVLDVTLDITLTNLRSDVYITEYGISLPKNVSFKNLRVSDDFGKVPFVTSEEKDAKVITFKFGEPESARSVNTLKLEYSLDNMRTHEGNIHEAILPLMESSENGTIKATLHLPSQFNQKLSIAKPVPTTIDLTTITWDQVKAKAIHVIFGESQTYATQLHYSLFNNGITPATKSIVLPPETLYQKTIISSLVPKPDKTYTDEDGNFIAEYSLLPRETKEVEFNGYVQVFVKPQSTLRDVVRSQFSSQRDGLLSEQPFWRLEKVLKTVPLDALLTPKDIYTYVVDTLDYDPRKLVQTPKRLGAEQALLNVNNAVCTEFTDAFIALAREKGIPSREMLGIGYSKNDNVRPLSRVRDVLHAWPEYYDIQQEIWRQIDPTWEDTSGIDYFTGFDVNHIALAIHGKNSEYPQPAGFYKTKDRKDISVSVSQKKPLPLVKLAISTSLHSVLTAGETYTDTITVTNTGNAYVHSVQVVPEAKSVQFDKPSIHVELLAPYESKSYDVTYHTSDSYQPTDTISYTYDGAVLGTESVRIVKQGSRDVWLIGGAILGIGILLLVFIKIRSYAS